MGTNFWHLLENMIFILFYYDNIIIIIIMLVLNFDNSKLQGFPINHSGMHAIDVPYTQCVFGCYCLTSKHCT